MSDLSMSLLSCCSSSHDGEEEEAERPCLFNSCSDLPNDLIVEILCRLPEKPLIRFKCVSKGWYFMISNVCVPKISPSVPLSGSLFYGTTLLGYRSNPNSDFFIDYAPYPPSPPHDEDKDGVGFVESYSALLPFNHSPRDLLHCCNGLLLFVRRSAVPAEYYVCNPATKQCVAIPPNPTHLEPKFASLAFNPSESLNYKIVCVTCVAQSAFSASISDPPKLDIFSSDTGKWVTHAVPLDPAVYGIKWLMCGVYFNGVGILNYSRCLVVLNDPFLETASINPIRN